MGLAVWYVFINVFVNLIEFYPGLESGGRASPPRDGRTGREVLGGSFAAPEKNLEKLTVCYGKAIPVF